MSSLPRSAAHPRDAKSKGMSVNQLVISLLEKDMGIDIVTIREQNKQNKENKGE